MYATWSHKPMTQVWKINCLEMNTWKVSIWLRSNKSRNLCFKGRFPVSPFSPYMVMKTLALVPEPFSSAVITVTSYITGSNSKQCQNPNEQQRTHIRRKLNISICCKINIYYSLHLDRDVENSVELPIDNNEHPRLFTLTLSSTLVVQCNYVHHLYFMSGFKKTFKSNQKFYLYSLITVVGLPLIADTLSFSTSSHFNTTLSVMCWLSSTQVLHGNSNLHKKGENITTLLLTDLPSLIDLKVTPMTHNWVWKLR